MRFLFYFSAPAACRPDQLTSTLSFPALLPQNSFSRFLAQICSVCFILILLGGCNTKETTRKVISMQSDSRPVASPVMDSVYQELQTPYKYGVVLKAENEHMVDCPGVFRHNDRWYMIYIIFDGQGYETALAVSDDLLHWQSMGKVLPFRPGYWDALQAAGSVALQDFNWQGSYQLSCWEKHYWFSYLGGALRGYETDPLAIGMAWTDMPHVAEEWQRLDAPVLSCDQVDVREFEKKTLYRSHVIYDATESLGFPFVMFYNGKLRDGYERIGMAVSKDMHNWSRYGVEPVIDNGVGISGDPQIIRMGDLWVMVYFGAFWQPKAFDTFACSYDLKHWTKWAGPHLVSPSEPWDEQYAHKPWMIKYKDVVYHYYCAVGNQGRVIALATSKPMQKKL